MIDVLAIVSGKLATAIPSVKWFVGFVPENQALPYGTVSAPNPSNVDSMFGGSTVETCDIRVSVLGIDSSLIKCHASSIKSALHRADIDSSVYSGQSMLASRGFNELDVDANGNQIYEEYLIFTVVVAELV